MAEPLRLVDSHSHFDDYGFDDDRDAAYARACAAGVTTQIVPAVMARDWGRVRETCARYPGLHPAYGLHPVYCEAHLDAHLEALDHWLTMEPAVAVGECGLDWFIDNPDRPRQQQLFEAQLELAASHRLPVIVHARRSVEDVLLALRRFPGLRGVLHSYAGSGAQARRVLDRGFLMSFGGPITYARATRLHQLVRELPLEAIMLETDAPDQPDAEHRGMRNEPALLPRILEEVALLRGESLERVAEATSRNARELFGIS